MIQRRRAEHERLILRVLSQTRNWTYAQYIVCALGGRIKPRSIVWALESLCGNGYVTARRETKNEYRNRSGRRYNLYRITPEGIDRLIDIEMEGKKNIAAARDCAVRN